MNRTWPTRSSQEMNVVTKECHRWLVIDEDDDFLRGKVPDFFPDLSEDEE